MKKQLSIPILIGLVSGLALPVEKSYSQGPGLSFCDVTINPNLAPVASCTPKPGYTLILEDHFNSFNASIWDKSSPGDDQCGGYQNPDLCICTHNAPMNESNVIGPSGGILRLRVREGEDMNVCDYSGAEIKTFNNIQGLNPSFRSWKVNVNNYVEARVKIPNCEGVGAAFWLRGATKFPDRFFEIDVFEYDHNTPSTVKANVHYAPLGQGCDNCISPEESIICSSNGSPLDLTAQYLVFGVDVTSQAANLYINNVFYRSYPFSSSSPYNRPLPFDIRFNSSNNPHDSETNPSNCNNLPQYFDIDYVRVFQKAGTKAIKFTIDPASITLCSNNECVKEYCNFVKVNYIPGVTYQWEPHANFTVTNESYTGNDVETFKVIVAPGTPPGDYQLKLKATFPCNGYQEELILKVKVMSGIPPTPSGIFLVTDDNNFYYPGTYIAANTTSYEWSMNGGLVWTDVPNPLTGNKNLHEKFFKAGSIPRQVTICVRAKNACGTSPTICQTLVIPAKETPCPGCLNLLLPPREISAVPSTLNPLEYQLRVVKSPYSQSYEWSFDREQWNNVSNANGTLFNDFGPVESGLDSFTVHVRAKNADTVSTIYSQKVSTINIQPLIKPITTEAPDTIQDKDLAPGTGKQEPDAKLSVNPDAEIICLVYNMMGQVVFNGTTSVGRLKQELATGTYLLVQNAGDPKQRSVRKLVIAR